MANTGVLPFVRGVDFTKNDFEVCTVENLYSSFPSKCYAPVVVA